MTEQELSQLKALIEKAKTMLSTEEETPEFIFFNGEEIKGISITTYSGGEYVFSLKEGEVQKVGRDIY